MNITLSADEKLIDNSRMYAKKHNTSLNNLVREYLKKITNESTLEDAAIEFGDLARDSGGESTSDYKFNRDAIYERGNY